MSSANVLFYESAKQELLIERANGQYLIDSKGDHYLDLINNVAHGKYTVHYTISNIKYSRALSSRCDGSSYKANAVTVYKYTVFEPSGYSGKYS